MTETTTPPGGAFLISEVGSETIFVPEKFTDDQRMFAQTASRFMQDEVYPNIEKLEHPSEDFSEIVALLKKAGEIGLLMIDVPEEYGGLGLDKTTSMLCSEIIAPYSGFSVSWGGHTGIGTMPITFFGTTEQKKRWLPRLASGELLAAYALTEPGSGSDALAAKTTAMLSDDGENYILNGSKMWITNAGFADLFTVFCQVGGDKFTAFVVPADAEGLSLGAEERKMGLKGSSTRLVMLDNVVVPKDHLLGAIGKGHKIAFNILNVGRFKLGVGSLGGAKHILEVGAKYAAERRQFGRPISSFGAIREKLSRSVIHMFALESMCYRVAGYMDESIDKIPQGAEDYAQQVMAAIEEYTVEDSIMKVYGSEVLDFVTDEMVQVHGGYGYSEEYTPARMYRDVRINRIFEGTNEINRMLIPGTILKRTMKGQLSLFAAIAEVDATISGEKAPLPPCDGLQREKFLTTTAKRLTIFAANQAIQKHMADLKAQQQLLLIMADMIIACYAMDSTVARVLQLESTDRDLGLKTDIASAVVAIFYPQVVGLAERLLENVAGEDESRRQEFYAALDKLSYRPGFDLVKLGKTIAEVVVEREAYPFT